MSKRIDYEPGTFSWADLATTELEPAKEFYQELFGWENIDMPMGDDAIYSMMRLGDEEVAAMAELREGDRGRGIPPHWNSYVSVADADASAARVKELDGTVISGPFDVFDAGRMAVIQDPVGAMLCLWQARDHIGAGRVNEPGALCWNELHTRDVDRAISFYSELFGWQTEAMEMGEQTYIRIDNKGSANGGIFAGAAQPGKPAFWLPYFACKSLTKAVELTRERSGEIILEPMSIGQAQIAVIADPQGAHLGLFEGPEEEK